MHSIFPKGLPSCWTKGQCSRRDASADNKDVNNSQDARSWDHLQKIIEVRRVVKYKRPTKSIFFVPPAGTVRYIHQDTSYEIQDMYKIQATRIHTYNSTSSASNHCNLPLAFNTRLPWLQYLLAPILNTCTCFKEGWYLVIITAT